LIAALTITVVGPELPPGAGEHRSASLCFCGRGMPPVTTTCIDCGYVVPRARPALERLRERTAADAELDALLP
jgi:hypothetical protein